MSLLEKMKSDMLVARVNQSKGIDKDQNNIITEVLRVVIGEVELVQSRKGVSLPNKEIHSIIRTMINSNNAVIDGKEKESLFDNFYDVMRLKVENGILLDYLPKRLSKEGFQSLIPEQIKESIRQEFAKNEKCSDSFLNKTIGQIMKALNNDEQYVDGNDLKEFLYGLSPLNIHLL